MGVLTYIVVFLAAMAAMAAMVAMAAMAAAAKGGPEAKAEGRAVRRATVVKEVVKEVVGARSSMAAEAAVGVTRRPRRRRCWRPRGRARSGEATEPMSPANLPPRSDVAAAAGGRECDGQPGQPLALGI